MIEIIKKGTRKTCTCNRCGCVFTYEHEDIHEERSGYIHGGGYEYIECPQCNIRFYLGEVK